MAATVAAVPAAERKTLMEWIEQDDGDTPAHTKPACDSRTATLHGKIAFAARTTGGGEPLPCPAGLRLPPLG